MLFKIWIGYAFRICDTYKIVGMVIRLSLFFGYTSQVGFLLGEHYLGKNT
ncbi:hypothetical protein [Ulvibacter litoralis]|uniref:Uncharacterized protein n=1 Tax=Ulvibacter litoralis TaxID=227084 RepID=A0A1G7IM39_9FLAO|nr:hypothetical protein [Ulvibacter litoralis]SDF13369.1 hypothetical protein SAMN05421855_10665 [Ulvibacter litoralis]